MAAKLWIQFASLASLMLAAGVATSSLAAGEDHSQFKSMDANGDGRVSAAEHAASAKQMLEMTDTDKDGFVSAAEMEAGHARMLRKAR